MAFPELSEADVRSMIRLVGDVAACRGGATEKRRVLMDGLIKLVHAQRWLWTLSPRVHAKAGERPRYMTVSHGGFHDGLYPKLLKAIDHPPGWGIYSRLTVEIGKGNSHLTWTRTQMDAEGLFLRDGVREIWEDARVGDFMISVRPLDTGDLSGIGIYRDMGSPAFDGRDARMVHIVLAEVPWLHVMGWTADEDPADVLPTLSPRRRTVLNLVLEGQSRKEMAASLGISTHTLDGYVKDIFRHFQVHSQAELIARFRSGDGGKTPDSGD